LKVPSWTPLLIKADQEDDSVTASYIIRQNPYLSLKMLQDANCYPLHRLAKKSIWNPQDRVLFNSLLDCSRYFQITDLDSENNVFLHYAVGSSNTLLMELMKERECLVSAFSNLRARTQVNNIVKHYYSTEFFYRLLSLIPDEYFTPTEDEEALIRCVLDMTNPNVFFPGMVKSTDIEVYMEACFRYLDFWTFLTDLRWSRVEYYDTDFLSSALEKLLFKENPLHIAMSGRHDVYLDYLVQSPMFKVLAGLLQYKTSGQSAFQCALFTGRWWVAAKIVEIAPDVVTQAEKTAFLLCSDRESDQDPEWNYRVTIFNHLIGVPAMIQNSTYQSRAFYPSTLVRRVLQDSFQTPHVDHHTHLTLAISAYNKKFCEVLRTEFPVIFRQQAVLAVNGKQPFEWALEKFDLDLAAHLLKFVQTQYRRLIETLLKREQLPFICKLLQYEKNPHKSHRDDLIYHLIQAINRCITEEKRNQVSVDQAMYQTEEYAGHRGFWMVKTFEAMQRREIVEAEVIPERRADLLLFLDLFFTVFGENGFLEIADENFHLSRQKLLCFYKQHNSSDSECISTTDERNGFYG
jgi:hypothetical protein